MDLINYRMGGVESWNIIGQINEMKSADLGRLSGWDMECCPEGKHLNIQEDKVGGCWFNSGWLHRRCGLDDCYNRKIM